MIRQREGGGGHLHSQPRALKVNSGDGSANGFCIISGSPLLVFIFIMLLLFFSDFAGLRRRAHHMSGKGG